ncbi:MAG: tRNA (N(6)-L-threonylcarbamoyladenosine(37)-C(2))-methylthiotransferase MtaB [Oscillospiraceae bacterium]|nr:tRNA (N(6)-L-threonylcarbamoyladenosine(37)-C(2))-methylthiotransferase MtaB [Oscillospiraceae bacterium]MBR4093362.1 tRNA (N(6)-L-threonylcarbamoyladenosine(37)-C(2))-methylthiotransferase MtaB [Oscillospiraceae bacterium]
MKIHYITFGCKVNLYETECMKELLVSEGYEIAESEKNADIFIINTCTVTSESDKKLRKTINRIRKLYAYAVIALTGCFVQAFPKKAEELDVEILIGNGNKTEISSALKNYFHCKAKHLYIDDNSANSIFESMCLGGFQKKTRAFLKIQDGCNQFCTYCIIPKARGRICSKPVGEIRKEVEILAENGYKEVVIVGINLSFYGKEFGLRLIDAIETVCSVDGIERVRLGSLEPEVISDEDIERMSRQKKLCPQFHLSLQSGCDRTLKAMNRHYSSEEYAEIVSKLRSAFKDCAITTDIMVGFPDETEDDFEKSYNFVKKMNFSQAHIFPYSKREGTIAYKMENQVNESVKNERAKKMAEITNKSHTEFMKSHINGVYPVLFEREQSPEFHNGHTPDYLFIKVLKKSCEKSLRNQIFYVRIDRIENDCCIGHIIQ